MTLGKQLAEFSEKQGLNSNELKQLIEKRLVEVAQKSTDAEDIFRVANLFGVEITEELAPKLYENFDANNSGDARVLKRIYRDTEVWPDVLSVDDQVKLVLSECLPISTSPQPVLEKAVEKGLLQKIEKHDGYYSYYSFLEDANVLDHIKKNTLDAYLGVIPNIIQGKLAPRYSNESVDLHRVKELVKGVPYNFSKHAPTVQSLYETLEENRLPTLKEVTGLKAQESEALLKRYETIIEEVPKAESVDEVKSRIKSLEEILEIPFSVTPTIQKIAEDNAYAIYGGFDHSDAEKTKLHLNIYEQLGIQISKEVLEKKFEEHVLKRLQSNHYWMLDSHEEFSKEFNIPLSEPIVQKTRDLLLKENSPKAYTLLANFIGEETNDENIKKAMQRHLEKNDIDSAIAFAEYFCVRPELKKEQFDELTKYIIEKNKTLSYEHLFEKEVQKVKEIAQLAQKDYTINPEIAHKIYDEIIEHESNETRYNIKLHEFKQIFGVELLKEQKEKYLQNAVQKIQESEHHLDRKIVRILEEGIVSRDDIANHMQTIYKHKLDDGKFEEVYESTHNHHSGQDIGIPFTDLETVLDWLKNPIRDFNKETKEKLLRQKEKEKAEYQQMLIDRENEPKYMVSYSDSSIVIDVNVPIGQEAKFVYGIDKTGRKVIGARPLYECGYHAHIVGDLEKNLGEIQNITGGWIIANNDTVKLDRASERYGKAPMDEVLSLLKQYEAKQK